MDNPSQDESHPLAADILTESATYEAASLYRLGTSGEPQSTVNYKVGSLNFERVINDYSVQSIRRRFSRTLPLHKESSGHHNLSMSFRRNVKKRKWLFGFTGRTATRWFLTVVASLLTGLTSIGLVISTSSIVSLRASILHSAVDNWDHSIYAKHAVFLSYMLTNLSLSLSSSLLCVCFVPHAAGSGIPEVKAYLNGVRSMHKLASARLLIVKVVGTILSVSSGLSVGQEGPLIHIGAIMGASCTKLGVFLQTFLIRWNWHHQKSDLQAAKWSEQFLSWTMKELSHFATDAERRDLVSIGAAVGFAASFGAPIGGLLFILDDVSCYFERRLLLKMLIGNAIGTFCLAVKHRDMSNFGIINLGTFTADEIFETRLLETPLYVLIGLGGGVLGGIFCAGYLWLRRMTTIMFTAAGNERAKCQILEVVVVSVLTSVVLFYLPTSTWACKVIPRNVPASILADYEMQEKKRFFCPEGQINEMAAIMFGSRIAAIKDILADPTSYQQSTLFAVGSVFYILTLIAFGTCMPSGLFTPTILVGATLGGACGNLFNQFIDEDIFPSTFALLGVASMLAGIQRSTVSVAVILVEGTGQIKVLLPVIIVVAISRYVAQSIQELGIFELAIALKKLPYLEQETIPRYFDAVSVKDLISETPVCLQSKETVRTLVDLLSTSRYESYPVVQEGSHQFIGLIKRSQIAALLECGIFYENETEGAERHFACGLSNSQEESETLEHWAFCINDDRYAHILSLPDEELDHKKNHNKCVIENRPALTKEQESITKSMRISLRKKLKSKHYDSNEFQEFCTVSMNEGGSLIASFINAKYDAYWVDLAAAANRGAYIVTEFCPVSKAYSLCKSKN